jgi:hypothetical protein
MAFNANPDYDWEKLAQLRKPAQYSESQFFLTLSDSFFLICPPRHKPLGRQAGAFFYAAKTQIMASLDMI